MNCNEFKAIIDSFLDGELNDRVSSEFEVHFTSCDNCRMELESVDKCSKILRGLLKDKNPPQTIKNEVFREFEREQ